MKYALISDIHSNLPALEAVLADIAKQPDVEATYHLGDLVGYAPWPDEVVKLIQSEGIAGVAGNYDSTVGTSYKHCGCRYENPHQEQQAHLSFEWTKHHSSDTTKQWLRGLPFRLDIRPFGGHVAGPTVTLIHGNQTLNTVYVTEDRSDDFLAKMGTAVGAREHDIIAFGHTHKPWHRVVGGVHYVNTGSVGRPKDGNWKAGYALLTINESGLAVEFPRVEYDVDRTAKAIEESELPNDFAEYLRTGGVVNSSQNA